MGQFRRAFAPFHDVVQVALMGLPVVTGVLAGAGLFGRVTVEQAAALRALRDVGRS